MMRPPGQPGGSYPHVSPPQLRFRNFLRKMKTRKTETGTGTAGLCDDLEEQTSWNRRASELAILPASYVSLF